MAQLLKTDGSIKRIAPTGKYFTLHEIQSYVGGSFECSHCPCFTGDRRVMLVNEDGSAKNLPVNRLATELYRATHQRDMAVVENPLSGQSLIINGWGPDGGQIVGNVLVCECTWTPEGEEFV